MPTEKELVGYALWSAQYGWVRASLEKTLDECLDRAVAASQPDPNVTREWILERWTPRPVYYIPEQGDEDAGLQVS